MQLRLQVVMIPLLACLAHAQEPVTTLIGPDSLPHQVPLSEFVASPGGGELACPDPHYHAANGVFVTALDGMTISDPFIFPPFDPCGFGELVFVPPDGGGNGDGAGNGGDQGFIGDGVVNDRFANGPTGASADTPVDGDSAPPTGNATGVADSNGTAVADGMSSVPQVGTGPTTPGPPVDPSKAQTNWFRRDEHFRFDLNLEPPYDLGTLSGVTGEETAYLRDQIIVMLKEYDDLAAGSYFLWWSALAFDSRYFKDKRLFNRDHIVEGRSGLIGAEVNYIFQGIFWAMYGIARGKMHEIITTRNIFLRRPANEDQHAMADLGFDLVVQAEREASQMTPEEANRVIAHNTGQQFAIKGRVVPPGIFAWFSEPRVLITPLQ